MQPLSRGECENSIQYFWLLGAILAKVRASSLKFRVHNAFFETSYVVFLKVNISLYLQKNFGTYPSKKKKHRDGIDRSFEELQLGPQ